MPLVVHSFMEDTVNPYGTIVVFLVEKDVVSDFMAHKPGLDDIVLDSQVNCSNFGWRHESADNR